VVGADTLVVLDGEALGKPGGPDEARTMLRRLRGRPHEVLTGVAAVEAPAGRAVTGAARTVVLMAHYSDAEIDAYVASGQPLDKAGAYGIQDRQGALVAGWIGPYSNVVGLPLALTRRLLADLGVALSAEPRPRGRAPSPPEAGSSAPGAGDDARG
jgi:MAF protein